MYDLPKLDYKYDALGKYISKDIMELHHSKHHQHYVDVLNAGLDELPYLKDMSLESLLREATTFPEKVRTTIRNNAGGHYNHLNFWLWLSPDSAGEPNGELLEAIKARYGSFQKFMDEFTAHALGVFGSGWVWLMPDLSIMTTANQDSPLMFRQPEPILGLDVWEHAYYLDYTHKRADYVASWWHVINWDEVAKRYALR